MIILCFIIGIIGCVAGGLLVAAGADSCETKFYIFGLPLLIIGIVAALIFFVGGTYCLAIYNPTIEAEISMYQEENFIIEEKMASLVENYMLHEKEIMFEVAPESSITLINMYPELTSQTLVSQLLDTYQTNTEAIKELKTEAIKQPIVRWWLYFGK